VTRDLTLVGKTILTVVMFVGRLGPLVIAVAVSRSSAPRYIYAEEDIMVG
jgi:trk/ktr system potassium uptake protein